MIVQAYRIRLGENRLEIDPNSISDVVRFKQIERRKMGQPIDWRPNKLLGHTFIDGKVTNRRQTGQTKDRQINRQIAAQIRQIERHKERKKERQVDRQIDRQIDEELDRQIDRQIDEQK